MTRAQGEVDKIEADIVIAEDASTTKNRTAMANYRAMVAGDLGLMPSEANGWRSVFEGRLSTAQNALPGAQKERDDAKQLYETTCANQ